MYPTSKKYEYAAKSLLATVDINMQNVHECTILDSGATIHLLVIAAPTSDCQEAKNPLSVKLPDGARVSSTHTYTLAIPYLHAKARIAHIIPGLAPIPYYPSYNYAMQDVKSESQILPVQYATGGG